MTRYSTCWMLAACLGLLVWTGGCERAKSPETAQERIERSDEITQSPDWPEEPRRIVSLAPNITELLFELGLGDRVVGVTRYCDWPEQVEEISKIGGMLDPDYEAILAVEPDVVIGVKDGADHQVVERLDNAGVAYGFVEIDDIVSIKRGMLLMGQWLGVEDRAAELEREFSDDLTAESREIRQKLDMPGATALIVYDQEPIVAAGAGSFGHELLILAGLDNALGEDLGQYPVLDMEKVLSLDPALIIDVSIGPATEEVLRFWNRFDSLEAVREERVIHIDDPVMMRPGPRIPVALRSLGAAVEAL